MLQTTFDPTTAEMSGLHLYRSRAARPGVWRQPLFLACVVVPTLLALVYFGLLASDVYVSESRFIVRGQDRAMPTSLGLLLNNAALNHGTPESNAAQSYLQSRDALAALNRDDAYARAYSGPMISRLDRFGGLGLGDSFEDLYRYYAGHVRVETDTTLGITVLTVRAYSPGQARAINEHLLRLAESTVNQMSERARQDMIVSAQREVFAAKDAARAAGAALARYRNSAGVVDPEKQAPIQYELVSKLQDELIEARSDRRQLAAVAPQSTQIAALDARIAEIGQRMAEQSGLAAGNGRKSLAAASADYARLSLDADFAAKRLAAALASLESAENEAQHQSSYVERIVEPNLPDKPIEPRRARAIVTTVVFSLIVWGVATMLLAGIKEHGS
jgi:capsular polysaccharide transport system permease protein